MRGYLRKHAVAGVTPDMNVTPLVDVVLVLLIIFMVVAPRMDQDVPVELPGIFNPDPDTKLAVDPLKVSMATAGEYYIDDQKYDLDGALERLTMEHGIDPYRRVVLRADAKLKYGDVRQLFSRTQEIGFPGLSLLVGEKNRPGQASDAASDLGGSVNSEPAAPAENQAPAPAVEAKG